MSQSENSNERVLNITYKEEAIEEIKPALDILVIALSEHSHLIPRAVDTLNEEQKNEFSAAVALLSAHLLLSGTKEEQVRYKELFRDVLYRLDDTKTFDDPALQESIAQMRRGEFVVPSSRPSWADES